MNPYYSHESDVGPVYDVATFSRIKPLVTAFAALAFAFFTGLGAVYFWSPDLIDPDPSEVWADAHQEAKDMMKEHPVGMKVGIGMAALFSVLCLAMSASCVAHSVSGNYYIRVGQGGLSLRVPDGLTSVLEQDIPWSEIARLTVIQEKQIGSLSRGAGNTGGELELHFGDGSKRHIRLDHFKPDAWLIHQRITEMKEMETSTLLEDDSSWHVDNDQRFTLQNTR